MSGSTDVLPNLAALKFGPHLVTVTVTERFGETTLAKLELRTERGSVGDNSRRTTQGPLPTYRAGRGGRQCRSSWQARSGHGGAVRDELWGAVYYELCGPARTLGAFSSMPPMHGCASRGRGHEVRRKAETRRRRQTEPFAPACEFEVRVASGNHHRAHRRRSTRPRSRTMSTTIGPSSTRHASSRGPRHEARAPAKDPSEDVSPMVMG